MKKKLFTVTISLMVMLAVTGCGKEHRVPEHNELIITEITPDLENDNPASTSETVQEIEIEPVVEEKESKTALYDYMVLRTEDFSHEYTSNENGIFWEARFYLYDINKDGRNDLIVTGALGLRCKMFTDIVLDMPNGLEEYCFDGVPTFVRDNYVFFDDMDYSGAGEENYITRYVVCFEDSETPETVLRDYTHTRDFDENGNELAPVEILEESYYFDNEEHDGSFYYQYLDKLSEVKTGNMIGLEELSGQDLNKETVTGEFETY